jgi:hypothetical protein
MKQKEDQLIEDESGEKAERCAKRATLVGK